MKAASAALGLALLLAPGAPRADEAGDDAPIEVMVDPIVEQMRKLDEIAPFEDKAPLWSFRDAALQRRVEQEIRELGLMGAVKRKQLAVALVDLSDRGRPRAASMNGDEMMYAASLPKIAILLAAFEKIAEGNMELDDETEDLLERMIRESSNTAATAMMRRVGKEYIARVLLNPRYRLYDPQHNGGLWVGKDYASAGLWRRDPLHNLSHGATAMQVARFYYLLETGNLVTPEHSRKMKEILGSSRLRHKFVRALQRLDPRARLFRKSGSWRTYHSDSAIVQRNGSRYIAVALSNSPQGGRWLGEVILALDEAIFDGS